MTKKKSKMRNLVAEPTVERKSVINCCNCNFITILVIIIGIIISFRSFAIKDAFLIRYTQKFNVFINCSKEINYENIADALQMNIIGQSSALDQFIKLLNQRKNFTSIGIIGSTGTGKTLLLNTLQESSEQWNIYNYAWGHIESDDFNLLQIYKRIRQFTECTNNVLTIDDLEIDQKLIIPNIDTKLRSHLSANERIKVIVIYVFSINRYSNEARLNYEVNLKQLQTIDNVDVIQFRDLNQTDLALCIDKASDSLNVSLNYEQKLKLMSSLDVERAGCKNVRSKVALYF